MLVNFWWTIVMASIVWYITITLYVSIRGFGDITTMFARLRDLEADDPENSEQ